MLHHVVSRMTSPFDPVALTIGSLHSGMARNIIAEYAEIHGTLRTLSTETQEELFAAVERLAKKIAEGYGAAANVRFERGYPVLINDGNVVAALTEALDTPGLLEVNAGDAINLAGDDFAYYLQKAPGAYGFLGCRPDASHVWGHHSPRFLVNEEAVPLGTMSLIEATSYFIRDLLK